MKGERNSLKTKLIIKERMKLSFKLVCRWEENANNAPINVMPAGGEAGHGVGI